METYVFVHGAWHGGWCWEKVTTLLNKAGYRAISPDLPGHGENRKKAAEKITIDDYCNCIVEIIDAQSEPVILVGHSMGGIVISQVAEYRPKRIKKLVYLCAILLMDGESMLPNDKPLNDRLAMSEEGLKELFYNDCTDVDFEWAKTRLVHQPEIPVHSPIHITNENYGQVPRIYITTLNDRTIPIDRQKQMCVRMPCQRVISMNTSHSPFLSAPEELVENLILIASY